MSDVIGFGIGAESCALAAAGANSAASASIPKYFIEFCLLGNVKEEYRCTCPAATWNKNLMVCGGLAHAWNSDMPVEHKSSAKTKIPRRPLRQRGIGKI